MRSDGIRFSRRMKVWFYSVFGILFFSGIFWLALRYGMGSQYDFDSPFASLKSWLLRIHGGAAMASLIILGVLIPQHMRRAWKQKRNRTTAITMVSLCLSMAASGYGLYYCGDDALRAWLSGFHSIAGCLMPLILFWHIISGRKTRRISASNPALS